MEIKEYELIVSEGKKPIWKLIFASLLFTISIVSIVNIFNSVWSVGFEKLPIKFYTSNIKILGLTLSLGITLSITKTILIDTDKNKLVSRYFVGPFYRDILSVIPKLEYVSVFLDTSEIYQVNLWYNKNKHYKMYVFENKKKHLNLQNKLQIN